MTDVLVPTAVVAEHPPTRTRELQRDHGDQQHPDKGVDGEQRLQSQQRCSLHREQQEQYRCHGSR